MAISILQTWKFLVDDIDEKTWMVSVSSTFSFFDYYYFFIWSFFMLWLVPWSLEKIKQARKLGTVKGVADLARQSKEKPNRMEWKRRKV